MATNALVKRRKGESINDLLKRFRSELARERVDVRGKREFEKPSQKKHRHTRQVKHRHKLEGIFEQRSRNKYRPLGNSDKLPEDFKLYLEKLRGSPIRFKIR